MSAYEEFNDSNPFSLLLLDCAVPTIAGENDNTDGKLTAVITYKTRYTRSDGTQATLKFGLGKDIQVNAIVGIPTIKEWELILDLKRDKCISELFNIWFPLDYDNAAAGLPPSVTFDHSDFVRPPCSNPTGAMIATKAAN